MRRRTPPNTSLIAVAALASCLAGPAPTAAATWKPTEDFVLQFSGGSDEGGKVYKVDADSRARSYLVDLPSEPTLFLVDLQAMTAFAIRREDAVTTKTGAVKTRERFAWNVPVSSMADGTFHFPIGDSELRIVRQEPKRAEAATTPATPPEAAPPTTPTTPETTIPESSPSKKDAKHPAPPGSPGPPDPAETPTAAGPDARECVSLEVRPGAGVPGCTRFVYVRNTCDAPIVARVQRTEHLMTGTLPQAFDTVVAPGDQWLGCAWWSGAMAPAKHEILGAAYLHAPGKRAAGRSGAPPRR